MPTATLSWREEQRLDLGASPAPEFQSLIPIFMSLSCADCAVRATLGFVAGYLNA